LQSKASYATVVTGLLYLLWCKKALRQRSERLEQRFSISELFVAALVLASKYLNDRNAFNAAWSRATGIPLVRLNVTEMVLLSTIEYRLHVDIDLFDRWVKFLFRDMYSPVESKTDRIPKADPPSISKRIKL
jgi:hypothetical protein